MSTPYEQDRPLIGEREDDEVDREAMAKEKFGGVNLGAAFFGWLVAVAVAVLLAGVVGAIATAVDVTTDLTAVTNDLEAGTVRGWTAAGILLGVLLVSYYAGGYVAGRMSRYDGARQGLAVWTISVVVTLLTIGLGAVFGAEYDVLDRVSLPSLPLSLDALTTVGLIAAGVMLVATLLGALLGGSVGQRYHRRVDRIAGR